MANVSFNLRGPNATYIPPAHVGLALGLWGLTLGEGCFALGPRGVLVGSVRVFGYYTNMLVSAMQKSRVGGIA